MDRFIMRQLMTPLTCKGCCRVLAHHSRIAHNSLPLSRHQTGQVFISPIIITRLTKLSGISSIREFATHSDNSKERVRAGTINIPFWGRLAIVSGIVGAVFYLYQDAQHVRDLESEEYRYKEFKKINLGGDWTLTDHHGNKRSSTDFRGQWIVMYMGFTHCPDICPEEMEKLGQVVLNFDKDPDLPNLQPVFITLDPERDSPSVVKDYLREFVSSRIVGFTGSEEDIHEVAKKFRAYFGKGERNSDNDYIVDHTIIIYLINPQGEFVNYYDRSLTAEQVTESIKKHVSKYNELKRHH